jgi:hypothetical protein
MSDGKVWATGSMTTFFLVLVLALDIGGAGTMLAIGAAKAQGQPIHVIAGP